VVKAVRPCGLESAALNTTSPYAPGLEYSPAPGEHGWRIGPAAQLRRPSRPYWLLQGWLCAFSWSARRLSVGFFNTASCQLKLSTSRVFQKKILRMCARRGKKILPEDQGVNARATGEVVAAEQPSNNDKGDVENTFQVLAELKKQQREAPFKAPQMDSPVQYTVLAENPATNPADAHGLKKFGLHQPRPSPGPPSSVTGSSTAATDHTASSCVPRPRRPVRPRFRA
jgi:hypothetical protein